MSDIVTVDEDRRWQEIQRISAAITEREDWNSISDVEAALCGAVSRVREAAAALASERRKVAGLEAQVALDTGNIERMREAGESAERKVERLREAVADLRAKNGKRCCDCTSCDCGNVWDASNAGNWDGADWVLNVLSAALSEDGAVPSARDTSGG